MHFVDDEWVMFWTEDNRRWSPCDNVVWINAATECNLGCKYCHDHPKRNLKWLDVKHLEYYKSIISGKLCLTITLNDLFLSPNLEKILSYSKLNDWIINAYSYFPRLIDLAYVDSIMGRYSNIILNWSLHRPTDEERQEIFRDPHNIEDVIKILKPRRFLNTIVIFSNQNPKKYRKLLKNFNPNDTCINFVDFINYSRKVIEYNEIHFKSDIPYRTFHPSLTILKGFQYAVKKTCANCECFDPPIEVNHSHCIDNVYYSPRSTLPETGNVVGCRNWRSANQPIYQKRKMANNSFQPTQEQRG